MSTKGNGPEKQINQPLLHVRKVNSQISLCMRTVSLASLSICTICRRHREQRRLLSNNLRMIKYCTSFVTHERSSDHHADQGCRHCLQIDIQQKHWLECSCAQTDICPCCSRMPQRRHFCVTQFKCYHIYTLSVQPNMPEQTMRTQITCHTTRRLIRVYTVCLSSS